MGCSLCVESDKSDKVQDNSNTKRNYEISLYSLGFLNQIGTSTQTQRSLESSSSSQDSFLDQQVFNSFQNSQFRYLQIQQQPIVSSNNNNNNQPNQIAEQSYQNIQVQNEDQEIYRDSFNFSTNYYETKFFQNDQTEI